jgi:hypothetical protein
MKSRKRLFASAAVGILAFGAAIPSAASAAEEQPQEAPLAAEVGVFVTCNADGSYAWTATGSGFTPNSQNLVSSNHAWTFVGGGGEWGYEEGHGAQRASAGGFVTTPTYYSQPMLDRRNVSIIVTISGVQGSGSDDC